jgi:hypothetical protein
LKRGNLRWLRAGLAALSIAVAGMFISAGQQSVHLGTRVANADVWPNPLGLPDDLTSASTDSADPAAGDVAVAT